MHNYNIFEEVNENGHSLKSVMRLYLVKYCPQCFRLLGNDEKKCMCGAEASMDYVSEETYTEIMRQDANWLDEYLFITTDTGSETNFNVKIVWVKKCNLCGTVGKKVDKHCTECGGEFYPYTITEIAGDE